MSGISSGKETEEAKLRQSLSSWVYNCKSIIVLLLANDQLFPGAHPFPRQDRLVFRQGKVIAVVERT